MSECINLYPEQLRQIAAMCEALNVAEGAENPGHGMTIQFAYGIPLSIEGGDGHIGCLVDEVGEWSFRPESPDKGRKSAE